MRTAFAGFVAALGGCAIIGGASTMEPAWIEQARQVDLQREQDLRALADAIVFFKISQKELPYDLSKLGETPRPRTAPLPLDDPESGQPYDYSRVNAHSYKLCATFKLETLPIATPMRGPPAPWRHSAGANCFVFDGQSNIPLPNPTPGEERS